MIEGADGEVLLTREEFKVEFLYTKEDSVDKAIADGLPVVTVNRTMMFPRLRCQAWYRGEEVKRRVDHFRRPENKERRSG